MSTDPSVVRAAMAASIAASIEGASRLELRPELIAARALDITDAIIKEIEDREIKTRALDEMRGKAS